MEVTHPRRSGPVPSALSPIAHSLSGGRGVGQRVSVHGVSKILLATGQLCSSWLSFHSESRLGPVLPPPAEKGCCPHGAQRGRDSRELPPASPQR